MTDHESLTADTFYRADFIEGTLPSQIASLYTDLVEKYDTQSVLVVKRFGSGTREITDALRQEANLVEQPRVVPLIRYAHTIIDKLPDVPERLSSYERSYLFDQFLQEWDWTLPYLKKASQHDSFVQDVEQFSIVASWQGSPDTSDPVLEELTDVHNEFQKHLQEHNYVEHANIIHSAREAMENSDIQDTVQHDFSAVIVLEAEDYTTAEREFVKSVTGNVPTHWVVTNQSDVQRTRNESGILHPHDIGDDVDIVDLPTHSTGSLINAVAAYLTGSRIIDVEEGEEHVAVLNTDTFEAQIRAVAEEIERLREETELRYDDVAIVLKDTRSPIRGVIEALNGRGIPTASTTVSGFSDDPTVRELYTVAQAATATKAVNTADLNLLKARAGTDPPIDVVASFESVVDGVWEWIRRTDLKERIANNESEIDARSQFSHVNDVIEFADFIERSSMLDGTWEQFRDFLEFSFEHAAPDAYGDEIDSAEGGVLVDAAQRVKTGEWNTVFVVNAVDQEYPSEPRINQLFPRAHMNKLPEFPMVSAPTTDEVRNTFETATSIDTHPFRAYYSHYSRRLMGVAARAARNRLYFTTYRERRADPGKYRRPSRFLVELLETFPQITTVEEGEIHTESRAVSHTLDSIDRTLDEIRRAPTADEQIDIDEIERTFGAIQQLLSESERGNDIADAIAARADFAEGVVRRE